MREDREEAQEDRPEEVPLHGLGRLRLVGPKVACEPAGVLGRKPVSVSPRFFLSRELLYPLVEQSEPLKGAGVVRLVDARLLEAAVPGKSRHLRQPA